MPTLEENIAAALAEGSDEPAPPPPDDTEAELEAPEDDEPEPVEDDPTEDEPEPTEEEEEAETTAPLKLSRSERDAILSAIQTNDVEALVVALGSRADALLGGKAHASIRRKSKDLLAELSKLEMQSKALEDRFGDSVAVRRSIEEGEEDAFERVEDHLHKLTGKKWNEFIRWAAKAATGQPERLGKRKAEEEAKAAEATKAEAQITAWVEKQLASKPIAGHPEAVKLVMAKLKEKGVETPEQAIPLVMRDLKQQYERLGKLFTAAPAKPKAPAPAAIEAESPRKSSSRKTKLEENIAWALGRSK